MTTIDHDRSLWNERLTNRWRKGAAEYGDASFLAGRAETVRQILEEVEDTAGWMFVLWVQARIARGDMIDLAHRLRLQAEFLDAMKRRAAEDAADWSDPVGAIEFMAASAFYRWRWFRQCLANVLHLMHPTQPQPHIELPATRGRRGSNNDWRSSD